MGWDQSVQLDTLAACCLVWYLSNLLVCGIGCYKLYGYFTKSSPRPISPSFVIHDVPHVTIIRPVKGLEPFLYECLAATFHQKYPSSKLTIYFCLSDCRDPAYSILTRLLSDYPSYDARIFIEEEDPFLSSQHGGIHNLGPNPKIRNMSRAYREAKSDIIWIIDCNVWVSPSVTGLMVDRLCGFNSSDQMKAKKYEFVHQLPLVVDVSDLSTKTSAVSALPKGAPLEALFLSTSHAKYYTAISTVAIAPCTVGKSNMFRRSHLDALTPSPPSPYRPGIDHFSHNICEDHLIGDLLWKSPIPASVIEIAASEGGESASKASAGKKEWGNHAMLPNPPCIQPVANLSLASYAARRTRWLRVRKFTVPLATLVEPGTESLLCTFYGAFGLTGWSWCNEVLGIQRTWTALGVIWIIGMMVWCTVDWWVWSLLQGWEGEGSSGLQKSTHIADDRIPSFIGSGKRLPFRRWVRAWLGREILAGPIWTWAIWGGTTVLWRGRRFKVGMDMRVKEVGGAEGDRGKVRID